MVLAVFNPLAATVDGAPGSLRDAISIANSNGEDDTINLESGTYSLTLLGPSEDANASGDLDIGSDGGFSITLNGSGAGLTMIDRAGGGGRILHVLAGANAFLNDLTISGGETGGAGGGIRNEGTLEVNASTITGNSAGIGGGLYNLGTLTVQNATISGNTASFTGGGIRNSQGTATISLSTISGNSAQFGGGLFNYSGSLDVIDSTITGNLANFGGGLENEAGDLTVSRSTIAGNSAVPNIADFPGFPDLEVGSGGGIRSVSSGVGAAALTLTNSTISGNTAVNGGGGLQLGDGGGVSYTHQVSLLNLTVTGNYSSAIGTSAGTFVGAGIQVSSDLDLVTISNSIVAGNTSELSMDPDEIGLRNGAVLNTSNSFANLIADPASSGGLIDGTNGNIVGDGLGGVRPIDSILDTTLADNGGPTLTHALVAGSVAIDNADSVLFGTDQRGIIRPQDGDGDSLLDADIGAFEAETVFTGMIQGTKFNDVNGDGDDEQGAESGLPGVTMVVSGDSDQNGVLDTRIDVTDQFGIYRAQGLAPGDYQVTEAPLTLTTVTVDLINSPVDVNQEITVDGLAETLGGGELIVNERVSVIDRDEQWIEISFDAANGGLASDINGFWRANFIVASDVNFSIGETLLQFRNGTTPLLLSGTSVPHPFDPASGDVNTLGGPRSPAMSHRLGAFSDPFSSLLSGSGIDPNLATGVTLISRLIYDDAPRFATTPTPVNVALAVGQTATDSANATGLGNEQVIPELLIGNTTLVPTLTIDDVTVDESVGSAIVSVSLNNSVPSGFTVDFATADGTATQPSDYTAATGTLTFLGTAGETQTIVVPIVDDSIAESIESLAVSLGIASNDSVDTSDTGAISITDNDIAVLTVNDVTVDEAAGTATVTVLVDIAVDGGFTVDFSTADGTATQPNDYTTASGTLSFAGTAGESQTFTVPIIDDSIVELTESLSVSLSNPSSTSVDAIDSAVMTVTDDDAATLVVLSVSANEDDGPMTFTLTLSGDVDAPFTVTGSALEIPNQATAGVDFTAISDTVSFSGTDGEVNTVTVPVIADAIVEQNEFFQLDVFVDAGGRNVRPNSTFTGTILNDDTAILTVNDVTVNENTGTATVTVSVDNAVDGGFTVDFATTDGTATQPSDYTTASGTLSFVGTAGETQTFMVPIVDDAVVESIETTLVSLSNSSNTSVDAIDTAVISITDNDTATVLVSDITVSESVGTAVVSVTVDNAVQGGFTVGVAASDGTATAPDDYTASATTLTFAGTPGESQTFSIPIVDDGIPSQAQDFFIQDTANNGVARFDGVTGASRGLFVGSGSAGLTAPHNPTFGPDGNLYVLSGGTEQILRYNGTTGDFIDVFVDSGEGGFDGTSEQAFGPDGNLYLANAQGVFRFDPSGNFIDIIAGPSDGVQQACGIEFGRDGLLYVYDTSDEELRRFDPVTGALIDIFIPAGNTTNACDFDFGPDGDIFITDLTFNQIRRFSGVDGSFLGVFANTSPGASGITFGPDGNFYVNVGGNTHRFDGQSGAFLDVFVPGLGGFGNFGPLVSEQVTETVFVSLSNPSVAAINALSVGTVTISDPLVQVDVGTSITESADPIQTGDNVVYTITVTNSGSDTATNVVSRTTVPTSLTVGTVSTSVGTFSIGSVSPGFVTVTGSFGTIAPGASATVTINATATVAGAVTVSTTVDSPQIDFNLNNNSFSENTTIVQRGNTIVGNVFCDRDHNTSFNLGEEVFGARVFIDSNNNAFFDSGELSTFTDSSGAYRLSGLPDSTVNLSIEVPSSNCNSIATNPGVGTTGVDVGDLARAIESVDIDGDFDRDVVVAADLSGTLTIIENTTTGFEPGGTITLGDRPQSIFVSERGFSSFQEYTIAVAGIGAADGGKVFTIDNPPLPLNLDPANASSLFSVDDHPEADRPSDVVLQDFNNDGVLDFAYASFRSPLVEVNLSGFSEPIPVATSSQQILSIDVGHVLNSDLTHEIVVAGFGYGGPTQIETFAIGNSGVSLIDAIETPSPTVQVALENVFADQNPLVNEIVQLHSEGLIVYPVVNGEIGSGIETRLPRGATSFDFGDFNNDGLLDVGVASLSEQTIQLFSGAGDGRFALISTVENVIAPSDLVVDDFNGDGFDDMMVANLFTDGGTSPQSPQFALPSSTTIVNLQVSSRLVTVSGNVTITEDFRFRTADPAILLDTTGDNRVTAMDALRMINALNRESLAEGEAAVPSRDVTDVNGDGRTSAIDALAIINYLTRQNHLEAYSELELLSDTDDDDDVQIAALDEIFSQGLF